MVVVFGILLFATSDRAATQVALEDAFPNLTFNDPVDIQQDGSGRLFVAELGGLIWVFQNHPDVMTKKIFLDIQSEIGGFQGLLGFEFHPDLISDPYIYVNHGVGEPYGNRIARYTISSSNPDTALASTRLEILAMDHEFCGEHGGGQLRFGPDGYLYVPMGDGGYFGDPLGHGQNRQTLQGTIMRIDVDSTSGGMNYSIPSDNPYVGNAMGFREEIWAYGVRNPWRSSFDPATGDLWVGDVGQDSLEEVNIIYPGANYGWNRTEGSSCYNPPTACDTTGITFPIWEYGHSVGHSITGGYVYHGALFPDLVGKYIYGDFIDGQIWALDYDGNGPATNTLLVDTSLFIVTFGQDEHGELLVGSFGDGKIYRLTPVPTGIGDHPPAATPALLSNFPNPFGRLTTIGFVTDARSEAKIDIFDVRGKHVRTIFARPTSGGRHDVQWDGETVNGAAVPSGVYFYRLEIDGETIDTKRMVLLR